MGLTQKIKLFDYNMGTQITYTTDIAHCMGCGCALQDECYRNWLHRNSKGFGALYVDEQYDFETEECEMFKPIEP